MTQLEIEIQVLEGQLQVVDGIIQQLGSSATTNIIQQRDDIQLQLNAKKKQLAAQKKETVYEHLARTVGYSPQLKACIEETVDKLLQTNISNANDPGLLLGKIQCGKTRAFVGVMGLAFDRGIDACVVLTKADNGLVEQTFARMEYEFRDYLSNVNMNQCCVIGVHKLEKDMRFTQAQINNQKNIFICHKNTTRLKALIKLFKDTQFKDKHVLIIDDEADFVSRAFYQRNDKIAAGKIALLIDKLVQTTSFCRYLQVTATPYSLFLQPDHQIQVNNGTVEPFRPRFTTLVPIHKDYVGGKHYFIKSQNSASMYSYIKHIVSDDCMNRLLYKNRHLTVTNNAATTSRYADLRSALMSYFVASAIRQLQEESINEHHYNSSFFMHISTTTKDHNFEKHIVDIILKAWENDAKQRSGRGIKADFDIAYQDLKESNEAGNKLREISIAMPAKKDIWDRFLNIFEQGDYIVQVVNSNSKAILGKDGQLKLTSRLNIFIGGFKLDRGITIDHMLGFMYGRNPQVRQADAVLQHHRMYGNRSKEDMAVTRLHTTQSLYNTMEWIDNMDHQLREIFVKAMQHPNDPVPMITIQYDRTRGVRPCATNKLLISDLETFDSFKRFTPAGFQTDSATKINPIIDGIDNLLKKMGGYSTKTPFLISKDYAYQILKNIRSTYIYNRVIDHNVGLEWDEDTMIAAIEKYVPADGKIWCYVQTNRKMNRIRKNGNFVDAPEDGNTDTPIARQYTSGNPARPFLMLFRENGLEHIVNKKNIGWRNAPFYWPCLRLPQGIETCMYCK